MDTINNFSNQTGVIAYANIDTTITATAASGLTAGNTMSFNGTTVFSAGTSYTVADIATAINTKTGTTGITASVSGANIRLTGTNIQNLQITTYNAAGTATSEFGMTPTGGTLSVVAGIRLDSVQNSPISISLGDWNDSATTNADSIGFLEQNVGAADYQVNAPMLGVGSGSSLSGLNVSSVESATAAISTIDNAIEKVSSTRSKLGAMENRLNNVVNNLTNISTNTSASRSRIQDTDYATETTALAKSQIISQAATAMLAQANQQPQTVLSLLK